MCGAPIPAYTFCVQCPPPLSNVILCLCHTWLCQGVLTSSSLLLCYLAPVEWSMINQAQLVYPGVALPAMLVFVFYAVSHPSFSFNIWPDTLNLDVRCPHPFMCCAPCLFQLRFCCVRCPLSLTVQLLFAEVSYNFMHISVTYLPGISYAYHTHIIGICLKYFKHI